MPLKGTEQLSTPQIVPGAEIVGKPGAPIGITRQVVVPVPAPPEGPDRGVIVLTVMQPVGVTRNNGGEGITVLDLAGVNPAMSPVAYSFPGGDDDDNEIQWLLAVPSSMSVAPNMTVTLWVMGQGS